MKNLYGVVLTVLMASVFVNCANQNKKIEVPQGAKLRSIYYDFDRSFIRSDAVEPMQGNATYLKANPNVTITIEGNCDNRGTNEYNLALGHRRAESAKNYLMNLGISSARMRTVSFGEEKPVCYENTESCWQRNRRADFRKN